MRIGLNSGLSAFVGPNSSAESWVNYSEVHSYTISPTGKQPVLSYGLSGNYKLIRGKFLAGLDAGYENLRTKTHITGYTELITTSSEGHTILNGHFITVSPFMGCRLPAGRFSFDLQAGLDLQRLVKEYFVEKGEFMHSNGQKIRFENDRNFIRQEIRPRFQVTGNYKKMSLYGGYSMGILNYYEDYVGGNPEAKMNTLRFGLQYRIL